MLKISNSNYFLPTIEALSPHRELGSGRTKPMLIRGVCQTQHTKSDYVVKYKNAKEMSIESSCRELIASTIAMELELHIPPPALINITPQFIGTLNGFECAPVAQKSAGINFGCEYFAGYMELLSGQKLNNKQLYDAQRTFAFDVFISNSDRRRDKQNMLTNGESILIFDHEAAFGFILALPMFRSKTPWIIPEWDKVWIKNHYLFDRMKYGEDNFSSFIDNLSVLDKNFWDKMYNLLPKEWVTEQVNDIIIYLQAIVENKEKFLKELNQVLL